MHLFGSDQWPWHQSSMVALSSHKCFTLKTGPCPIWLPWRWIDGLCQLVSIVWSWSTLDVTRWQRAGQLHAGLVATAAVSTRATGARTAASHTTRSDTTQVSYPSKPRHITCNAKSQCQNLQCKAECIRLFAIRFTSEYVPPTYYRPQCTTSTNLPE